VNGGSLCEMDIKKGRKTPRYSCRVSWPVGSGVRGIRQALLPIDVEMGILPENLLRIFYVALADCLM